MVDENFSAHDESTVFDNIKNQIHINLADSLLKKGMDLVKID